MECNDQNNGISSIEMHEKNCHSPSGSTKGKKMIVTTLSKTIFLNINQSFPSLPLFTIFYLGRICRLYLWNLVKFHE
ncbi:unnamed protein product [Gordionus sp. m RMFG-2023]